MATRRISRGRSGSPVPVIVLSVIVVGLLGSTIVFGLKVGDIEKERDTERDKYQAEADNRKKDNTEFQKYITLVGWQLDEAGKNYARLKEDLDQKSPLPSVLGEPSPKPPFDKLTTLIEGYADRCNRLEKWVTQLEAQLVDAQKQYASLDATAQAAKTALESTIKEEKARADRIQTEKDKIKGDTDQTIASLNAEIEKYKGQIRDLTKQVASLSKNVEVLTKKVAEKEKEVLVYKFPKKSPERLITGGTGEPIDGHVISVDPDGKHVMIDIGRKDWVAIGMEFKVYDTDTENRHEKGTIQVRKVMDTIAQAKVMKQDDLDPILPGMVLVNPAFERGKTLEFVLVGRFRNPNVERLLERYPCKIAKEVTHETDYVVVGQAERRGDELDPMDSKDVIKAKDYGIPVMTESELLRYLGEEG